MSNPLPAPEITRVEVIDDAGRQFTRWDTHAELSIQDEGRTLKVFLRGQVDPLPAPEPPALPVKYCIGCHHIGPVVGYTIERKPGPFCRFCWEALKQHVAEVPLNAQPPSSVEPHSTTEKRPWILDAWDDYEMAVHGKTGNTYEMTRAAKITAVFERIYDRGKATERQQHTYDFEHLTDTILKQDRTITSQQTEIERLTSHLETQRVEHLRMMGESVTRQAFDQARAEIERLTKEREQIDVYLPGLLAEWSWMLKAVDGGRVSLDVTALQRWHNALVALSHAQEPTP